MKKRITLLAAIFGILFIQTLQAQTYKTKLPNKSNKAIRFILTSGSISIKGYTGDMVIIKNTDYHAQTKRYTTSTPKRAEGLHAIGNANNTGIGLSISKNDSILTVSQIGLKRRDVDFIAKIPNKVQIKIMYARTHDGGDIHISNHKGAIEVRAINGDINLNKITGPVTAYSGSGNINVVFSHFSNVAPSSLYSNDGFIDVTLPASTKANIKLVSFKGKIYTDFNIKIKKGSLPFDTRYAYVEGMLNGGGTELILRTKLANIYLRKEK